jgi:hypothetical protein
MTWIYSTVLWMSSTLDLLVSQVYRRTSTHTHLGWTVRMAADDDYNPDQEDDAASDHLDDDNAPGPSKQKATGAAAGGADDVRLQPAT